ncbi:Het-C domain-containing protein [Phanerochaete sordida]|uniref:Het-C domain-containing protein n=1 Tax=Phanerochaete sordida TaxID=48140 RepID=A0A9P3GGL3_9APHY|nr:Het-C domain-containing protein [Phanerochaete sordida]
MGLNTHFGLIVLFILVVCVSSNGVYAFGAGNIPSFAYLEGTAFRHGDIEDALGEVAKKAGGFALGALIGKGGSKFGGLDIKRVYFGNWLRDYSQAVDVAGLSKLPLQTIINLCMALGFLAHGYATAEFEVTVERLGVYLPTEHIDNPKGYPDDAQRYDPRLRPPVNPQELEIDTRTGMKNYIANEHGSWDTSKALVRRTLERCIQLGRQHRASGQKQDEYEAYRLLGQALHTLEDFTAHSNFCELALVSMGHQNIFVHVGDQVRIQAPNGKWVAPLITGTFGSQDFIHSLLGEATDHISEASVSDLNKELDTARSKAGPTARDGSGGASDTLRKLLFTIPDGSGGDMAREMDSIERIRAGTQQGSVNPENMSPQELHAVLWQVLTFRDSVVKKIEKTIEKIPGLGSLIEKITDGISVFVFTTLEPFLKPLMKQATTALQTASGEVINKQDQYEVFNDPRASDPTHSFLSKDHFNLILNEPAGNLGKIVLKHTVNWVVKAWDDQSVNIHQATEDILSCLFHPDFHDGKSTIQRDMLGYMQKWVQALGNKQNEILNRLTKESVRNHQNIRLSGQGGPSHAQGTYAQNAGVQAQHNLQGYVSQVPVVGTAANFVSHLGSSSPQPGAGKPPGGLMGSLSNLASGSPGPGNKPPGGLLGSLGNMAGSGAGHPGGSSGFLGNVAAMAGAGSSSSPAGFMGGYGQGQGQGHGHGHHGHHGHHGGMPNAGGFGEASSFFSSRDVGGPGGMPNPGGDSFPSAPGASSFPGGPQSTYPGSGAPSFPGGNAPAFPGGAGESTYPGGSSYPAMPHEPHRESSYAPAYGGPPQPEPGYGGYGGPGYGGGSSYPPPPPGGPPGGGPGFPGAPGEGPNFPGAQPYGGSGGPSFPSGPGYGGPDRPYGY